MSKKSNLKRKKNKAQFNNEKSKFPKKAKFGQLNKSKYFLDLDDPNLILSDVKPTHLILNYAEPLLTEDDGQDDTILALTFAILAWNLALLPLDDRKEAINSLVNDLELDIFGKNELLSLIKRKDEYFGEFDFLIEDFKINFDEIGTLNFSVVLGVFDDDEDSE